MTKNQQGHLLALITILIWGTTFVTTKALLVDFSPLSIMLIRMIIATIAMFIIKPKFLKIKNIKHELIFAGAGLFGVTLYFLIENYALAYTFSGNVSIIVSTAPFFVALALKYFGGGERLSRQFYYGFIISMVGLVFICLNGRKFQLSLTGDILSLLAALAWAFYNVFVRRMEKYGYDTFLATRKIILYGIIFSLPTLLFIPFKFSWSAITSPLNICNLLFLGLLASALGFTMWNKAIYKIGAVKTSVYIYLQPVVTIIFAGIFLKEPFTVYILIGMVLTLFGLVISQRGTKVVEQGE